MTRAAPMPAIVIDTREQTPWPLTLPHEIGTVPTGGDYTIRGYETEIAIERKSLDDLVGSLTQGRERFERSLAALRTRRYRAIIVEGSIEDILSGRYRSRANPSSVIGSIAAIIADGVPIVFAGNANAASVIAERLLLKFFKRATASMAT